MDNQEESSSFEFTLPDGDAYRPEGMPILFRKEINGDEEEFKFFQELAYEGDPGEVIRNFKDKGNEFMKKYPSIPPDKKDLQKKCLEDAIKYYCQALTVEKAPVEERANCLSNRSYALMLYGTTTSMNNAKLDAFECVKLFPTHVRGLLRCLVICVETNDPRGVCASLRMIADNKKTTVKIPEDVEKKAKLCIKDYFKGASLAINMCLLKSDVKIIKSPVPISPEAKMLKTQVKSQGAVELMEAFHSKRVRLCDLIFSVQIIRIDNGVIDLINDVKGTESVGNILITVLGKDWRPVYLPDWECKCGKHAMECKCWKNIKLATPLFHLIKMAGFSIEPTKGVVMIYAFPPKK